MRGVLECTQTLYKGDRQCLAATCKLHECCEQGPTGGSSGNNPPAPTPVSVRMSASVTGMTLKDGAVSYKMKSDLASALKRTLSANKVTISQVTPVDTKAGGQILDVEYTATFGSAELASDAQSKAADPTEMGGTLARELKKTSSFQLHGSLTCTVESNEHPAAHIDAMATDAVSGKTSGGGGGAMPMVRLVASSPRPTPPHPFCSCAAANARCVCVPSVGALVRRISHVGRPAYHAY